MRRTLAAAILATACASSASATALSFSYTTQSGIVAQGIVEATDLGGFYSVDNVTGTRDGAAITGYDFFDATPQSFTYAGGQASDVDFSYYVGADNYEIRWPGNGSSFGTEFSTDVSGGVTSLLVTSFSLSPAATAAVPEPATWAMMMLGLGAIGTVMRRRHRVSAQIQPS